MNIYVPNKLHHISKVERTQLRSKLAKSVQSPHLTGYISIGNRRKFLDVEGSTAWL